MADLDLKVQLKIVDKASAQLKKFNKELERTKKNIQAVSKTSIKTPTGGGGGGAGGSALGGLGVGAGGVGAAIGGTALGTGLITTLPTIARLLSLVSQSVVTTGGNIAFLSTLVGDLVDNLNKGMSALGALKIAAEQNSETFQDLATFTDDFQTEVEQLTKEIADAGKETDKNTEETKKNTKATNKNVKSKQSLAASFGKVKLAVLAVTAVIGASIGAVIKQASAYENLKAKLTAVVGSQKEAAQAFALIKDTASKLPTTVAQTTEAFIRMQALGIVPTQERMIAFGNIASAMNKDILQFAEAAADAIVFEFERLKTFGIKVKQEGDKLAVTFQGNTKKINKSSVEIIKYLQEIGTTKFGDASALQMDTLTGKTYNLNDALAELKNTLGEGALLTAMKAVVGVLTDWSKWLNKNAHHIQRFGVMLVDYISYGWIRVRQAAETSQTYVIAGFLQMVAKISNSWNKFVNFFIEGWNSIVDLTNVGTKGNLRPVVGEVNILDAALAKLEKTHAAELKTHEDAMRLWNEDIPLTDEAKNGVADYNEVLKQRAAEQEKAAAQAKKDADAQKLLNEQIKEGKQLTEDMRTPIEVYRDTLADLKKKLDAHLISQQTYNRALKAAQSEASGGLFADTRTAEENLAAQLDFYDQLLAEGIITWDTYSRAVNKAWDEIETTTKESTDKMSEFAVQAAHSMEQSMSDFFFDIMQGKFDNLVTSFKKTLDRMVADMLASKLSSFLFGDFGKTGNIGGLAAKAGSFLTGLIGRASGGPMLPGEAYQVHAGEVVVPQTPQYVYPSKPAFAAAMGGGGQNINVSINAVDSQSFRDMIERDDRWLVDAIADASQRYNKGRF